MADMLAPLPRRSVTDNFSRRIAGQTANIKRHKTTSQESLFACIASGKNDATRRSACRHGLLFMEPVIGRFIGLVGVGNVPAFEAIGG